MTNRSSWLFWAILLPAMGTVSFAQVGSKNVNASRVPPIQATKDPKDMSRAELTTIVKGLDAELFGAYNDCDLEKFGSFFPQNLEFYHDQSGGGPMTREQLVAAIKENICGKVHRELVSIGRRSQVRRSSSSETLHIGSAIRELTTMKATPSSCNCGSTRADGDG